VGRFLVNRDFARLWYGQAVSTVGDFVFDTMLVLWVATVLAGGRSWAPGAVSGILVAVGVAVLVVGPMAGVFVDRWDRRATMRRTEVIRAALVGGLTGLSWLPVDALPLWLWLAVIYAAVFVLNAVGQFFGPARFATIGEVVHGETDRTRAAGIGQATTAIAAIVGPPLAAPLLFTVGLQWALLLNAVSYLFSYAAIRSLTPPPGPAADAVQVVAAVPGAELSGPGITTGELAGTSGEPVTGTRRPPESEAGRAARRADGLGAEFAAGLRYFAGNRFLVAILGIALVAASGAGALSALDIFFVTGNLHASPKLYGLLSMAFGVGAVGGALIAGRLVRRFSARTVIVVGLLLGGLLVIGYARQTQFVAGLVLFTLVAIPIAALNAALSPQLLAATAPEYLGRVLGVFTPLNQLAAMVSVVASGWLASTVLHGYHSTIAGLHIGSIDTIFTASGLLIALSAGYAHIALPRQPPTHD
jgi:MFS family permease